MESILCFQMCLTLVNIEVSFETTAKLLRVASLSERFRFDIIIAIAQKVETSNGNVKLIIL